jgi:hypothetical protein
MQPETRNTPQNTYLQMHPFRLFEAASGGKPHERIVSQKQKGFKREHLTRLLYKNSTG